MGHNAEKQKIQKEIDDRAAEKAQKEKEKAELKEKAEQQLAAKKKAEEEAEKVVEVPMVDAKESEEGPLQGPEVPPPETITTSSGDVTANMQPEHIGENEN